MGIPTDTSLVEREPRQDYFLAQIPHDSEPYEHFSILSFSTVTMYVLCCWDWIFDGFLASLEPLHAEKYIQPTPPTKCRMLKHQNGLCSPHILRQITIYIFLGMPSNFGRRLTSHPTSPSPYR
jgi:hypothetical protein